MTLRMLVDMNLSDEWVATLEDEGHDVIHWRTIGSVGAPDAEIMAVALKQRRVVFTHDMDFGMMLALTHRKGPSVLQLRGAAVLPEDIGHPVKAAIRQYEHALKSGALIVLDGQRLRVRLLPI